MSDGANHADVLAPRRVAAAAVVVLAVAAAAAVLYLLLDVLLLVFIGIVVAAALQPWHARLCGWGIPRGAAVLLIYLLLIVTLVVIALLVGPVLTEQVGKIAGEIPRGYTDVRAWLQGHDSGTLRMLGQGLPSLERLTPALSGLAPRLAEGTLGITTTIMMMPVYFVTVLAIGFYWTMEVAQIERLVLSLVAVERRPAALNVWHEIEAKLGGYLRGQGLVMLFIGAGSGIAYALLGLPNALLLGILAGLLEAVPFIGPVAAVGPAVAVALPLGMETVMLVVGFAVLLQMFEGNVLIPRVMSRAVGVSSLVSLFALLAFATLYGILGVVIAIPIAAVVQVLLDTLLLHPIAAPAPIEALDDVTAVSLRTRVEALQEHARDRLRARTHRMGIDPDTADHVVDAVDQQIELVLGHLARTLEQAGSIEAEDEERCVARLQSATDRIVQAIERADAQATPVPDANKRELEKALQRFRAAVLDVESTIQDGRAASPASGAAA